MILLILFLTFFKIGLFSFGGGYAAISIIEKEIVRLHHWLTPQNFADIVSISQSTPGAVDINSATFVGYQVGGILGAIIATIGVLTPQFLLVWLFFTVHQGIKQEKYFEWALSGVRPIIVGLFLFASYLLFISMSFDFKHVLVLLFSLLVLYKTKINPLILMLLFGLVGLLVF